MPLKNLKLVQVRHIRCDEYQGSTFVFAPADWDEETIGDKLFEAEKLYLKAIEIAREENPRPGAGSGLGYGGPPPYKEHLDKTVREVLEIHEREQEELRLWRERQEQTRRSFESFLREVGFVSLFTAFDDEDEYFEIDWGHRHGTRVDYSETDIDTKPTPAKAVEEEKVDVPEAAKVAAFKACVELAEDWDGFDPDNLDDLVDVCLDSAADYIVQANEKSQAGE